MTIEHTGIITFFASLAPKFYVTLTGVLSILSGFITILEWWYFRKYSTSFLNQISFSHIAPWIFGSSTDSKASTNTRVLPESKLWRNPMNLFRGAEYQRFFWTTNKEPLTYYDMNLSAQDHQTFFTTEMDASNLDYETDRLMQTAWRERNPVARIKAAHNALERNPECVPAFILLSEEEATTILEAEDLLKQALPIAEANYRRTQLSQYMGPLEESIHHQDTVCLFYVKRRLGMCARKLGKLKEAAKLFKDLVKDAPPVLCVHENLIEVLLEMQAYPDLQAVLAKYDDLSLPKSAAICYTAALLKIRSLGDKFSPDFANKSCLSPAETAAIDAIHRAVEFNPHVPKYLLETKPLILPPEHILKRGDSEAVSYSFFHLIHWKRIDGALDLLQCTWESTFRKIPFPLERGYLFYPYPACTEVADRELLPSFHEVSVYPPKETPSLIYSLASFASFMAAFAIAVYAWPQDVANIAITLLDLIYVPITFAMEKLEEMLRSNFWIQVPRP